MMPCCDDALAGTQSSGDSVAAHRQVAQRPLPELNQEPLVRARHREGRVKQVHLLLTGHLADGAYRNALLRSLSSSSEPKRGPSLLSVYCEMILEQGSGAVLCTGSPQIYEQAKEHLSLLQVRRQERGVMGDGVVRSLKTSERLT